MTLALALALLLVTGMNLRIGRTVVYPPALFSGIWTILLVLILLAGGFFYPLSAETLLIYFVGTIAFSAGGAVVYRRESLRARRRRTPVRLCAPWWTALQFAVLLVALPPYLLHLQGIAASGVYHDVWRNLRSAAISVTRQRESFGWYLYLITLSSLLALSLWIDFVNGVRKKRQQWLVAGGFVLALTYNLSTAGRLGAIILLVSSILAYVLRRRTYAAMAVFGLAALLIATFAAGSILLQKGGSTRDSFRDNAYGVVQSFVTYSAGGVIAFDGVVTGSSMPADRWRTLRFEYIVANALGWQVTVPSLVSGYTNVPMPTNVYTMYLPYWSDYGWFGVVAFPLLFGAATTWLFRRARDGDPAYTVAFSLAGCYLLLSGADEYLLSLTSTHLQVAAYLLLSLLARSRASQSSTARVAATGGTAGVVAYVREVRT